MAGPLDRRADRPLYKQLADQLAEQIRSMEPGSQLPSERELAAKYAVDRTTVRQAVAELRKRNLVTARHGKGIFVPEVTPVRRSARNRAAQRDQRGFWGDLEDAGIEATVVTTIEIAHPAPAAVAELFGVETGTPVLLRARHMSGADLPLQLARTFFHPDVAAAVPVLTEQNTGPGGMLARLEDAGYDLAHRYVTRARQPEPEEATELRLDEGSAILAEDWYIRDKRDGAALAITYVTAASNRNEFVYEG